MIRPEERWTQYGYDGTGNVVKEEHHDGTGAAYAYNPDGLLIKASNENGTVQLDRDRAGRIIRETQGKHTIERTYDGAGNCSQLKSSLGADVRFSHDREGNLLSMQAGESWRADWQRDGTGLELHRQLTGNISIRTQRDGFGREIRKSVGVRNVEQSHKQYQWGTGNRLQGIYDGLTGKHTNFDYDTFDNLIRADYHEGGKAETIYRAPDAIGNLYETQSRTDRKYDRGGRLLEDPNCNYYYDCEGNLIFKEFKKPQGYTAWGKEAIEKKFNIKMKATGTGWYYKWAANGMLQRVVNPEKGIINFGYDPLGRRIYKEAKQKRTCWLWDGNVPLHEWAETEREPLIDIITWVFEDGTFVPTARITDRGCESIVTDYLGTPTQMFDENGEKTWEAQLDIYGRVRTFVGRSLNECSWRYQGQYFDEETGLGYNRFRYIDYDTVSYISQDPIRLLGGNPTLYGYVYDPNGWVDVLGLIPKCPSLPGQDLSSLELITYKPTKVTPKSGTYQGAIDEAWALEKELVITTNKGTHPWTDAEIKELKATGKVDGYTGHHINNRKNGALGAAFEGDHRNIRFLPNGKSPYNEHLYGLRGHRGSYQNSTGGRLIDRQAMIDRHKKKGSHH